MKKYILAVTIFLSTLTVVQGQTNIYHPFPDSNTVWNEATWTMVNSGSSSVLVTCPNIFFLAGDTAISALNYKKVYSSGYCYAGSSCCYYYNKYEGAIRQDSLQKKVYYCVATTTIDSLLYDFNLNLGDTLPLSYINQMNSNYISSIDSILIGTKYRKQYHISVRGSTMSGDSNYVSLIEGIGSTFGLTYVLAPPFEAGGILYCFIQNNVALYTNSMGNCDLTVAVKENELPTTITVFPNPFSSSTNLTSNLTDLTVTIYNLCGQPVKQVKTNSRQTVINRDNLPSGLYFLRVTKDNRTVVSDKLVIVDN